MSLLMALSGVNGYSIPIIQWASNRTTETAETRNLENTIAKDVPPTPASVKEVVKEYFAETPIMAEVARCESHFRQFDADGKVMRGEINSSDVGVMQINEQFHLDRAEKLGFDLHTLEGNLAYAKLLYEEQGVRPWMSSSKCWSENQIAMRN